jgi:integrase
LRLILELAVKKQIVPHNFARDLRPLKSDKVSDGERRSPLSLEQIKQLFASEFYKECAALPVPYRADTNGGWRFWLPLIMLFAGMRPNEVCQLRTADIKKTKAGVHYFDVTSEESEQKADKLAAKSVKTRNSVRKVPVHPQLIELGLLSYLAERRDGGDIQLFPTLSPKTYGNYATYPARRFNERFLPDAVKLAQDQALYSIRHSFRDALRRVDAPNDALRALGGWADHSETSSDYGDRTNPDYQVKWIDQISYPGLDLTSLYPKAPEPPAS